MNTMKAKQNKKVLRQIGRVLHAKKGGMEIRLRAIDMLMSDAYAGDGGHDYAYPCHDAKDEAAGELITGASI